jgi:CRP-like cAMP-binding protein
MADSKPETSKSGIWADVDKASAQDKYGLLQRSMEDQLPVRRFAAGEFVFREGDAGDAAYVIRSGHVQVLAKGPDGQDVLVNFLREGAMFGEMSLLLDSRRTASVQAYTDTECHVIDRERFAEAFRDVDPWGRSVLLLLVNKLRSLSQLFAMKDQQF